MVANRQDAWTKEEDNYLAEVVLKSINDGSTQLMAFKIVAQALSRTAAACGYRWNSYVRKFYKEEIENAKNSSKKQTISKNESDEIETLPETVAEQSREEVSLSSKNSTELTFEHVYEFLENVRQKVDSHYSLKEIQSLENKLIKNRQEIDQLKAEKQQLLEKVIELENEYENLFEFIDQKRKFVNVSNSKNEKKVKVKKE
ncbi:Myb-like DNA-binding domain-containing protein [Bacillus sp. EAC]|uniref:Myb-like DNA-binding domain-containing protein n=1 Tax=Bacillus sp. EAC TaxID=1978338 RepID=UPI000B451A8C|nr:Myb-like DNA-binding domain-containing protein [Bacillus sp. EAC]